jgi:hypothetical protein
MAKVNPQIGTCPCPMKECAEVMAVKRFAARTDNALHARKAGKLYGDCPVHGRIGFDGSKATQEYLLEKSDIWDPDEAAQRREAAQVNELERKRAEIQRQPPAKKPAESSAPAPSPAAKKTNALW